MLRRFAYFAICYAVFYLSRGLSAFELLRYPGINASDFKKAIPGISDVDPQILARIDIDGQSNHSPPPQLLDLSWSPCLMNVGQYSAHLFRQEADLRMFMEDESLLLDPHMDYSTITGLSSEVRERLSAVRPTTMVSNMH